MVGCHYFPPGLRSPSQPKNITILRPVPSYTAWWQRHIGVNNLSKVVTQMATVKTRTHDLNDRESNTLPLSHPHHMALAECKLWCANFCHYVTIFTEVSIIKTGCVAHYLLTYLIQQTDYSKCYTWHPSHHTHPHPPPHLHHGKLLHHVWQTLGRVTVLEVDLQLSVCSDH